MRMYRPSRPRGHSRHGVKIRRSWRSAITVALFLFAGSLPIYASGGRAILHQKKTVIQGQIVAYFAIPSCLNGNGYWSILVRPRMPKNEPAQLIRVELSLPCQQVPIWSTAQPPVQKFRLVRQQDQDVVLEIPVDKKTDTGAEVSLPGLWLFPPGIEPFPLPFGKVLPSYRSLDFPLVPVV
jgi:hypothetical protein